MKKIVLLAFSLVLAGCSTNYQAYYGDNSVVKGSGGTMTTVEGVDFWENGSPSVKFQILGVIDDSRPGGPVPMAALKGTVARKALEAGGDAVIMMSSQSSIEGFISNTNSAVHGSANLSGNSVYGSAYGSSSTVLTPVRKNRSKFVVAKYLD